jgi:hypothetical protein
VAFASFVTPPAMVVVSSTSMAAARPVRSGFLNVDLDVWSAKDLSQLAAAFEPGAFALHFGPADAGLRMTLELARDPVDPESAIRAFLALVARLPSSAREEWDAASRRDFSIGVEVNAGGPPADVHIEPAILRDVSAVGAGISFVAYPRTTT